MKSRGPNVIQNPYTAKMIYLDYIKDKQSDSPYYVTKDIFLKITEEYHKALIDKVIFHSECVKLPHRLGFFQVIKKKPKTFSNATLSVDWEESKKVHKRINFVNDHTGGFKYRFHWMKQKCLALNNRMYRLVLSRTNKRLLAKVIKSNTIDYLEVNF